MRAILGQRPLHCLLPLYDARRRHERHDACLPEAQLESGLDALGVTKCVSEKLERKL
jgi:hypothetical protein